MDNTINRKESWANLQSAYGEYIAACAKLVESQNASSDAFWRNACNPSTINEERESEAKAILASIKTEWTAKRNDYMRAIFALRLVLRAGSK